MTQKKKTEPATRADSSAAPSTLEYVRALAEIVAELGLSRIRIEQDGLSLVVEKGTRTPATQVIGVPAPGAPSARDSDSAPSASSGKNGAGHDADAGHAIVHSPFVGTFYRGPSPGQPPFIEIGQRVSKGQVMCIVEAMKLMNEIEAEIDGTVVAVLCDNETAVEYNQPLFKIALA